MIDQTKVEACARKPARPMPLALRSLVGGSVIALACTLGVGARALTLGGEVQVTGADPFGPGTGPFSNCTADNVGQQEKAFGSINYPNTSIEPWVAVDPNDGSRLVMGHHQDRWDDGGARGLPGRVSTDGGSTWTDTIPPGVTECAGGNFGRGSDPWLTFAPDGTAFFLSLVLDPMQPFSPFGARNSGVLVSRSADHAVTWGAPTTLINTKTSHALNDKTSITADPNKQGFVYAVWDQLSIFPLNGQTAKLLAENDGVVIARELLNSTVGGSAVCAPFFTPPCKGGAPFLAGGPGTPFGFTGPTFFSMTKDNGNSWSTATPIFQTGTNAQTINNIVQVLPDKGAPPFTGDVLDFFTAIGVTPSGLSIDYIRSKDHGATWSGIPNTPVADIDVVGVVTPDSGGPIRDAAILFSVAVDPSNGNLYLAWQDDRVSLAAHTSCTTPTGTIPIDGIVFSQSTDGGKTWSAPVQINQTPVNAAHPCRQQAFIPAVVAASDGTVVVTYYDFRNDTDASAAAGHELTDYFALFCKAGGCDSAASWTDEQRLTATSFNILDAPVARGHFLGDYMGLAANGSDKVFPVFGKATGHNLTADFVNVISLP